LQVRFFVLDLDLDLTVAGLVTSLMISAVSRPVSLTVTTQHYNQPRAEYCYRHCTVMRSIHTTSHEQTDIRRQGVVAVGEADGQLSSPLYFSLLIF